MTTFTFAGHREVYQPMMDAKIEKAIRALLQTDSEFIFYIGGMGGFYSKCASAVRSAKRHYDKEKTSRPGLWPHHDQKENSIAGRGTPMPTASRQIFTPSPGRNYIRRCRRQRLRSRILFFVRVMNWQTPMLHVP